MSAAYTWGDGSDLHFLPLLPKATTALLKEISFPELRAPKTETVESQQLPAPQEMQQKPSNVQTEGIRGHSLHLGPQDFIQPGARGSPSCHATGRKFLHVHLYKVRKKLRSSSKMLNQLLSPVLHVGSCIANLEGHVTSFSSSIHCCAARTALLILILTLPSLWQRDVSPPPNTLLAKTKTQQPYRQEKTTPSSTATEISLEVPNPSSPGQSGFSHKYLWSGGSVVGGSRRTRTEFRRFHLCWAWSSSR